MSNESHLELKRIIDWCLMKDQDKNRKRPVVDELCQYGKCIGPQKTGEFQHDTLCPCALEELDYDAEVED
jgi:hypothetical protein